MLKKKKKSGTHRSVFLSTAQNPGKVSPANPSPPIPRTRTWGKSALLTYLLRSQNQDPGKVSTARTRGKLALLTHHFHSQSHAFGPLHCPNALQPTRQQSDGNLKAQQRRRMPNRSSTEGEESRRCPRKLSLPIVSLAWDPENQNSDISFLCHEMIHKVHDN